MNEISYRKINVNEAERAAEIHVMIPNELGDPSPVQDGFIIKMAASIREKIENTDSFLMGAFLNTKMIGFHWIQLKEFPAGRFANIVSLWVDPEFRKKGLARELKLQGENWAEDNGAVEITTHVNTTNSKMIALNEKLGFEVEKVVMKKVLK